MSRWFRLDTTLLDDFEAQTLPAAQFKAEFMAAVKGAKSKLSRFVRNDLRSPGWFKARRVVFERDAFTCTYCGEHGGKLECDHVFPRSRGGTDDLDNLTTACRTCNRSKRDKTPAEWLGGQDG